MKNNIFLLILFLSCFSAGAQDTISYGEGGYLVPNDSATYALRMPVANLRIFGLMFSPDSNLRVSGISCVMDSCKGHGVTMMLAKYIGPDSAFVDSIMQADDNGFSRVYSNNPSLYYQIIDSVRITPPIPPSRILKYFNSNTNDTVHYGMYDALFDTVYMLSEKSIYFVTWHQYPDFNYYSNHNNNWRSCLVGFYYTTKMHTSILLETNRINTEHYLDSSFFLNYDSVFRFELEKRYFFRGIFPIIDNLYDLPRTCPPVPPVEVSIDKRIAHFAWNSDTVHCAYELSFGNASQSYSTYTSVVTTDTEYVFNSMIPYERYACRLRAMCCFDDGDSIWSPWSDTVQYERPMCMVIGRSNNNEWGYVVGSRDIDLGDTVDLMAVPRNSNCRFLYWHTGDTANPLYVKAVCDTMLWAYFEQIEDTTTHGGDDDSLHTEVVLFADGLDVEMMPNPADNNVTFNCPHRVLQVELCDIHGRHIMQQEAHSNNIKLSLAGIPSGVYVAKVRTTKGWAIKKLVISHR